MYIERKVLVCFKKGIAQEVIDNFFFGINELKTISSELISFEMQEFEEVGHEEILSSAVANVIFPDLMTVWRFKDKIALEKFVKNEKHLIIAKERFKPAVEQRIVFNSVIN